MILNEEGDSIDTSADVNTGNSTKRPRNEHHDGRQYERTRPLLKRRDRIVNSNGERNEGDIEMSMREARYVELHSELLLYSVNRRHRENRCFYRQSS